MKNLDEISKRVGTDKASTDHGYTRIYQHLVSNALPKVLLEVGVSSGASILMWREWLAEGSKVYGVDIVAGPHVDFVGDQKDPEFMRRVVLTTKPDVFIDDASHVGSDQVACFQTVFPLLKSGAIYFVEDTHAWHDAGYGGNVGLAFFTSLVTHVNVAGRGMTGNYTKARDFTWGDRAMPEFSACLSEIHFYQSLMMAVRR